MSETILILGGSYAGVDVAHKFLRGSSHGSAKLKVVLVNPSPKFFWNMATVRAVVPGQIKDEQLFADIAPAFAYAGDRFEFIEGRAEAVDEEARTVEIKTSSGTRSQGYSKLITATGSHGTASTPWKHAATHEQTLDELHATQQKIAAAKSIVVGGGGSTGTELAAELGFEYGSAKDISIITAGDTLLAGSMTESINKGAEKTVSNLGVKIIHNTRVKTSTQTSEGKTELLLSDGKTLTVDLYLPSTGLTPNTSFLPSSWLDSKSEIDIDTTFKVKGATSGNVYALGDVTNLERSGIMITMSQSAALYKSLASEMSGKGPIHYKPATKEMMAVALGRKTGTGIAMGFKLPGFLVYFAKGKTLGLQNLQKMIAGQGM